MSRPVLIFPEAMVAAPVVAGFASAPAALRLGHGAFGVLEIWVAGAAVLGVPALALIAGTRLARRALDALWPRCASVWQVAVLFGWLTFITNAALVTVLKATTHHRALGAATFGALSIAGAIVCGLVAWRLGTFFAGGSRLAVWLRYLAVGLVSCTATVTGRACWGTPAEFDLLVFVGAAVAAASWDAGSWSAGGPEAALLRNRRSRAMLAGASVLLGIVLWGAVSLVCSPELLNAVRSSLG